MMFVWLRLEPVLAELRESRQDSTISAALNQQRPNAPNCRILVEPFAQSLRSDEETCVGGVMRQSPLAIWDELETEKF